MTDDAAAPAGEPASLVALHDPPGVTLWPVTVLASMVAFPDAAVVEGAVPVLRDGPQASVSGAPWVVAGTS